MPEGDTIYRAAVRLERASRDLTILDYAAREVCLDRTDLVGRRIVGWRAEGKNLILTLSGGLLLHSHLRMSGRWRVETPAGQVQKLRAAAREGGYGGGRLASMVLVTERVVLVCYNTQTLRWLRCRGPQMDPLRRLGPDLLAEHFDMAQALSRLRRLPTLVIGEAVMRQDIVAGIGNVYKSEALFLSGVNPFEHVNQLTDEQLTSLLQLNRSLMRRNLGAGPRRTRIRGRGGPRVWVYRRHGEHCLRCGTLISMVRQGEHLRSTYFCPSCQRGAEHAGDGGRAAS